ncbi:MAG: hypothetical protein QT05_C0015G0008 [archaeon GW2011_AR13]|nr:MAG: hypothetical protein QT05_C0015G0008 [archaeon GW2011_AR13]HIH63307.1 hypothetical protein [Nanoarchaeota archaeon]
MRGEYKIIFIFLIISCAIITSISALGVSPAIKEYNFQPNFEDVIKYRTLGIPSNMELELYAEGDLAEYVTIDKKKLFGEGEFRVSLDLPEHIEVPGKHIIYIGVKEKVDPELIQGTVGTSVTIQAVIVIYVPYPGKWIDASLTGNNVNVNESVNFELSLTSKGTEDVEVSPRIEISSKDKIIETLYFTNRLIKSQENIGLKKTLETVGYNPGTYLATAVVDYGTIVLSKVDFKIGELTIEITNHTDKILLGGVKRFEIEIESGWNNNIENAYAKVDFFNESGKVTEFKTSPTSLIPWEKKTIEGFFDTSGFVEGTYNANITMIYYGTADISKTSNKVVSVQFIKESKLNITLIAIIGAIILIIIMIIIITILIIKKKNDKKSNKSSKK